MTAGVAIPEALRALNDASPSAARASLSSCCGAARWVAAMVAARPFASSDALHETARKIWRALGRDDVLEAMSHHPRIGDTKRASAAESSEQAGAASADARIQAQLAEGNHAYEARYGHIYLVCASGRSGAELLAILQSRLANDPDTELAIAAGEQEKITALRLDKLVTEGTA